MFEESKECRKEKRCCVDIVITILAVIFTFIIGIIIGATTGIFDSLGLGAFVVSAVLIGILLIIRIVILLCFNCKKDKFSCR